AEEWVPLIVRVDFILEKPKAGVHFKLPDDDKQKYKSQTNSPTSPNQRTFHYNQPVAIPAQYIGVVCGPFVDPFVLNYPLEALPPNRPKIIAYISEEWQHWLLPTLYPDGDDEPTEDTYWLHRAMDYFIEEYSHFNLHPEFDKNNPTVKPGSFPFKRFQIVFVDHSYSETRRALIAALAQQWFGIFIPPYSW
ncbi:9864_t:CDS:2, partial [Racocetra fulgida]